MTADARPTRHTPEPMTQEALAATLKALAYAVRTGDSLEGSLEYLLPTPGNRHEGDSPGGRCPHLMVTAAYRVGNRTGGQGGMVTIGSHQPVTDGTATVQYALRKTHTNTDGPEPSFSYAWADDRYTAHAMCDTAAQHLGTLTPATRTLLGITQVAVVHRDITTHPNGGTTIGPWQIDRFTDYARTLTPKTPKTRPNPR